MLSSLPRTRARLIGLGSLLLVAGCSRPDAPRGRGASLPGSPVLAEGAIASPVLPVRWPADGAAPFELRAPGGVVSLAVRLAGARPVAGRWGDELSFDDALGPGTTLALRPRPDGLEDSVRLARTPGTCGPVTVGSDPDEGCPTEKAGGCGRVGTCDGQGHRTLYTLGTPCGPRSASMARSTARGPRLLPGRPRGGDVRGVRP